MKQITLYTIQEWRKTHKNDLNEPIMKKNHDLKCEAEYYDKVASGEKTFEIRFNDRNFKVGDTITLHRSMSGVYAGQSLIVEITYILKDAEKYGLKEGFVILSIK